MILARITRLGLQYAIPRWNVSLYWQGYALNCNLRELIYISCVGIKNFHLAKHNVLQEQLPVDAKTASW